MKIDMIKRNIGKSKWYLNLKKHIIYTLYIFPISKNKIIFDNFGGRGYGDDPKYIAEELLKREKNYKIIWVSTDLNIKVPKGIKVVKYGTIRAAYHWITAKVWVDNIKNTLRPQKRKNQFYIQTWHSTLGFKMNEQDAPNLPDKYISQSRKDAAVTDLMYSDNDFRLEKYQNRYWYSGTVIKCDVPRVGALMHPEPGIFDKVCRYFDISKEKKIVLYAPTFRKNTDIEVYKFNYARCKEMVSQKFGIDVEFIIRLHPNDAIRRNELTGITDVCDGTMYPDMQELLAASSVLITDYSGCMFDFGFTRKPVFLFAKDLEQYLKEDRKCYFSLDEVPFNLYQTEEELFNGINTFDQNEYENRCKLFEQRIGFSDSGHGAERIADIVTAHIQKEDRL